VRVQSGNSDSASAMQDINIAIIGARGAGKSVFIRRALNLPSDVTSTICTRKMTIDGGLYVVRFLEMSLNEIHIGERNTIKWPETMDDMATPRIDGAITVYDVTSQESLALVPEMLG
jgi:GTPase SAR1 family protein